MSSFFVLAVATPRALTAPFPSVTDGIRGTVRTLPQEIFGTDAEVTGLQGGWKVKDPIRQIYDRFERLDDRKKHLINWSDALLDFGMDIDLI